MNKKRSGGFTLIELLVVVLIIGILAAIALPQYFRVVERGRAAEALAYVGSLKGAEERYLLRNSAYIGTASLDMSPPPLKFYTASDVTANGSTNWTIILTRIAAVPAYGAYRISYVSDAATPFTSNNATATVDLLPQ